MAGIAGLLSAVAPFISQGIAAIQGAQAAEASLPPPSSSVSASRAALIPAALAPQATQRASPPLAVATLVAHGNLTAPGIESGAATNKAPAPAVQNQPPQVIVETNFIVYTKVETLPPSIITVTQTQTQPPAPPPPPTPPTQPVPPPPSPPVASKGPNAGPLVQPNPIEASPLLSALTLTPSPESTSQVAPATSLSTLPPPPAAPAVAPPPPAPPVLPPPPATTLIESTPSSPLSAPIMSALVPGAGTSGSPVAVPQAQAGPPGAPPMGPPDPANGAFPGGVPTKNLDLPITIMFMVLFMVGAYTHLSIYRRNAKRGHKFLISDLIFDFCMIRTVTCIFRITWSIVSTRGVIMVALITENGGAAVLFAVNILFAQRLVRSIHPKAGWCTAFGQFIIVLLLSVPALIILNASNLIISFFSVGNLDRLETTDDLLKFGAGYNMFLASFPVIVVTGCLCVPGSEPERFGTGSQRVKVALLYFGSFLLMGGHAIRVYALVNKEPPGTNSIIYGKTVFYTTGFMFEILVVAAYAFGRVDLRFHIPNGASGPGDYSGDKGNYSVEEIERLIGNMQVPHQIMRERKGPEDMEMVFAIFFATKNEEKKEKEAISDDTTEADGDGSGTRRLGEAPLPERPKRITRRQTLIDALRPQPPRPEREPTMYPDIPDMYAQMGVDSQTPGRPGRPSMYSEFETGQGYGPGYDARTQQYWGASPPYGNEKEAMKNIDLR